MNSLVQKGAYWRDGVIEKGTKRDFTVSYSFIIMMSYF